MKKTKWKVSVIGCIVIAILMALWIQMEQRTNEKLEKQLEDLAKWNDGMIPEYEITEEGILSWITGCFSEKKITSVDHAVEALQGIAQWIGLHDAQTELQENEVVEDDTGIICSFTQVYKGIPVYCTMVSLWADAQGTARFLRADCVNIPEQFSCIPNITVEEAKQFFLESYPNGMIDTVAYEVQENTWDLCIFEKEQEGVHLAWRIWAILEGQEYEAIVDATDGSILHMQQTSMMSEELLEVSSRDCMGKLRTLGITKNEANLYELRDQTRKIIVYDANGSTKYLPGAVVISRNAASWDLAEVSAMANLRVTYDFYKNNFGTYSYNNASFLLTAKTVKAAIFTGVKDNAYWSQNKGIIVLGEGMSDSFLPRSLAAGQDIVAHEFTHGVICNKTELEHNYYGTAGAINEGYADIFACLIDGDWKIGEDIKKKGCLRDIAIPFNTGNPSSVGGAMYLDYKTNSTDHGGVHRNSTIISHIAYVLYESGMSPVTIGKLWYKSLCLGYGKYADFYDVRINVLTAATALGFSSANITIIENAFNKANILKSNCQDPDVLYGTPGSNQTQQIQEKIPAMEIVLQWESSCDLDLSIVAVDEDGTEFCISYNQLEYYNKQGNEVACFYTDVIKGPGKESIQIWSDSVEVTACYVSFYGIYEKQERNVPNVLIYEKGMLKRRFELSDWDNEIIQVF